MCRIYFKNFFQLQLADDIEDPTFLSLEQLKEKENDEKRQKISTDNKNVILKMIQDLRSEFDEIMKTWVEVLIFL